MLGDRQHTGLAQPADGGVGVVPVVDLAVVPDMAEGVVLRRALKERRDEVIGVVQATGKLRCTVAVPRSLVEHHQALCTATAGPHRVAGRVAHAHLQCVHLALLDVLHAAEHLPGIEVVERTDLVVSAPLAPVARRVLEELSH